MMYGDKQKWSEYQRKIQEAALIFEQCHAEEIERLKADGWEVMNTLPDELLIRRKK